MDKRNLKLTLTSGSAKVFNCLDMTRTLHAAGTRSDHGPLFSVRALNYGVYFKEPTDRGWNRDVDAPIDTLLYFPYNADHLFEGGVSVSLNDPRFSDVMKEFSQAFGTSEHKAADHDRAILDIFRTTPSLDPYLLKSSFQRRGIPVSSGYLKISHREWEAIRDHVRRKLAPMIAFGLGRSAAADKGRVADLIERIWDGSDVSSLFPLLEALRIDPAEAADVVFAWKGLTFFEFQYLGKVPRIRAAGHWLKHQAKPKDHVRSVERLEIERRCGEVRRMMHRNLSVVVQILQTYKTSYDALFVAHAGAGAFQEFMKDCRRHYVVLGAALNGIDHCLEVFDRHLKRDYTTTLRAEELIDLVENLIEILR